MHEKQPDPQTQKWARKKYVDYRIGAEGCGQEKETTRSKRNSVRPPKVVTLDHKTVGIVQVDGFIRI